MQLYKTVHTKKKKTTTTKSHKKNNALQPKCFPHFFLDVADWPLIDVKIFVHMLEGLRDYFSQKEAIHSIHMLNIQSSGFFFCAFHFSSRYLYNLIL